VSSADPESTSTTSSAQESDRMARAILAASLWAMMVADIEGMGQKSKVESQKFLSHVQLSTFDFRLV
jgi:hypothetical protein